jgi:hypothetical protein
MHVRWIGWAESPGFFGGVSRWAEYASIHTALVSAAHRLPVVLPPAGYQPEPSSFRADEDLQPNNSLVFALGFDMFDYASQ